MSRTWWLGLLGLLAGGVVAAETVVVEVTGRAAVVDDDEAQASAVALADAQRLAVERGAGVLVQSETEVVDFQLVWDRLRTRTAGYLASYEIVRQGRVEEGGYEVGIRATVSLAPLAADLLEIPAVFAKMNRPRLMVLLEERDQAGVVDGKPAAVTAQRLLLERGFDLLDARQFTLLQRPEILQQARRGEVEPLLKAATEAGVEVVLLGRLETRPLPSPVAGWAAAGVVFEAEALETQTARLLASCHVDFGGDPAHPGATAADAAAARQKVAAQAVQAALLGTAEQPGLLGRVLADWATRPATLTLTVRGVAADLRRPLLKALQELRLVHSVVERRYADGTLLLEVGSRGDLRAVLDSLDELRVGDRALTIVAFQANAAQAELR